MKFYCKQQDILNEIVYSMDFTQQRSSLSILSNIYLETRNNILIIKATDNAAGFSTQIPVETKEEGNTTVYGEKFLEILRLLPSDANIMASTAKMGELGPQMEAIKQKYPNNPQKQNELMAELYKKEKINPMGGCLPMLIQFPILIAFFGLLNKHFELRGAMFIPGWIPDLSQPDTVLTFGFKLPFLGNQLHILPILYTFSMIYSMKITQNTQTTGQQQGMMKFMVTVRIPAPTRYEKPFPFLFAIWR